MVEVHVAADADNLFVNVALTGVVFGDDYTVVGVVVDAVVVAGLLVGFVTVAVDDGGVPAVVEFDARYLSNNL